MIGFGGLSHLGLVSAVAAASKGFEVVGYDEQPALVAELSAGRLPVHEPGLPDLVSEHAARLRFAADPSALAGCDVVFVAIDVPTDAADRSDLTPVSRLVGQVAAVVAPGTSIVVLSQVHPGFTRSLRPGAEARGARLYYQVETLIFGRAVHQAVNPERFMVGCADPADTLAPALAAFLGAFGCPVLPMRYESAELCKISINMFLVSQVVTTNMLAEICEGIGAEWREIAPALRLDRRIGPHAYLGAGLGVGGGNLQRDMATIRMLAAAHGADAALVDTWASLSQYRRDWALRTVYREVLARVQAPVLAVWGLSYKEDTQSTRNSPSVHLLTALSGIDVRAYDPAAVLPDGALPHVHRVQSALDACRGGDALLIMTPWREFGEASLAAVANALRGRSVIDPFGVLDPAAVHAAGLTHYRLGTGPAPSC
ncbi:MAG: nucleotide sugar dehydrogenase [SAR202 cluster bacterium]|nr:nucleotide sugar dehydrogenase [SAR202 cluster bacterium]